MAGTECNNCGTQVPRSATHCPECGVKQPSRGVSPLRIIVTVLVVSFVGLVVLASLGENPPSTTTELADESASDKSQASPSKPDSSNSPGVKLTSEQQRLALLTVRQQPRVRDAAIKQDGKNLSLVLVVDHATSEEHARNLGDNFVRAVKLASSAEPPPKKEIGTGVLNYQVGIYTPDEKPLARGAKVDSSPRITW